MAFAVAVAPLQRNRTVLKLKSDSKAKPWKIGDDIEDIDMADVVGIRSTCVVFQPAIHLVALMYSVLRSSVGISARKWKAK